MIELFWAFMQTNDALYAGVVLVVISACMFGKDERESA